MIPLILGDGDDYLLRQIYFICATEHIIIFKHEYWSLSTKPRSTKEGAYFWITVLKKVPSQQ